MARTRKYTPDLLVAMFRKAAALRNEMRDAGFTDNGGAIHSAERILNILGLELNYPNIGHINNLKKSNHAVFSVEAKKCFDNGDRVLIEHVAPLRHLTQMAIEKVADNATDDEIKTLVKRYYRLVLLSPEETLALNRLNRSTVSRSRLTRAGIRLAAREK
jgi:hypothetical protein